VARLKERKVKHLVKDDNDDDQDWKLLPTALALKEVPPLLSSNTKLFATEIVLINLICLMFQRRYRRCLQFRFDRIFKSTANGCAKSNINTWVEYVYSWLIGELAQLEDRVLSIFVWTGRGTGIKTPILHFALLFNFLDGDNLDYLDNNIIE